MFVNPRANSCAFKILAVSPLASKILATVTP